jgi:hypothetical protein
MMVETMEIGGILLDAKQYTMRRLNASKYRFKLMEAEGLPGPVIIGGREFYDRKAVDSWVARRVYLSPLG